VSVKLLDNKAFYGFRVRRTVAGKLYQEYFSLKTGGSRLEGKKKKEIEKEALARDVVLEAQQKRYLDETKGPLF
jgi:hypothetical protein